MLIHAMRNEGKTFVVTQIEQLSYLTIHCNQLLSLCGMFLQMASGGSSFAVTSFFLVFAVCLSVTKGEFYCNNDEHAEYLKHVRSVH
jgi:hypothetical protein